jgi:hypothetical protein
LSATSALVTASSAGAQVIEKFGMGRAERERFTCRSETVEACVERLRSALRTDWRSSPWHW